MAADPANQMGIRITQGGGVDQDQGIQDLLQTTRTFLIESRHHRHHQAEETGTLRYEIQARHSLMILDSTATVLHRQWTTPLFRLERDRKRLDTTLPQENIERGARGKSCQSFATSAVQNTPWKMPSSAVNVE